MEYPNMRDIFEIRFTSGNLKCPSIERNGEIYNLIQTEISWSWFRIGYLAHAKSLKDTDEEFIPSAVC